MRVTYIAERDVLALRFGEPKGKLADRELSPDIHIEMDESGKIVGIEILTASSLVNLREVLPVSFSQRA